MKRTLCIAMAVAMALVVLATRSRATPEQAPQPPPARRIPGINVEDGFPRACVGCHLDYKEMDLDVRLSTLMRHWYEKAEPKLLERAQAVMPDGVRLTGRHPPVDDALDDMPADCLGCHGKDSTEAPPFARMMHLIHLQGGEENLFLRLFQGECTHCHKLDAASGRWSIPSGAER